MTQLRPLVVVDTETTGLDRFREPWEVAALKLDPQTLEEIGRMHFFAAVDLEMSNRESLDIGKFYQRSPQVSSEAFFEGMDVWEELVDFTADCLFTGIQPSFDADTLNFSLAARGLVSKWHYKLIDVYDVLAGALGVITRQMVTDDLVRLAGIEIDEYERHTALGDVLMEAEMLRVARDVREGAYRNERTA